MAAIRSTRARVGAATGRQLRAAPEPIDWHRAWSVTAVISAVIVAAITVAMYEYAAKYLDPGIDYETVMSATRQFLTGEGFYPAQQLAGPWPYPGSAPSSLYPPDALLLFVPFTILPGWTWWAIPFVVTAWALSRLRPHPAAWLVIVLLLGVPQSRETIFWGNPVIWMVAAEAAGFVLGWPAVFVLLKPTLAPFAVAGFPRRSWRVALVLLVLGNLPLLPMWADWVTVIHNSQLGAAYSLPQYPLMAVPLIAWLGSRRSPVFRWLERRGRNANEAAPSQGGEVPAWG